MTVVADVRQWIDEAPKAHHLVLAGVGVAAAALVFRLEALGTPVAFDEIYHLLAARNWLATGEPAVLDGIYDRAAAFTIAVAGLFELTGSQSVGVGRLISLPAGIALPVVLFFWLRARDGWHAGLIAAAFGVLWPAGIVESQALRFYAWHVLAFLVGAIAIFEACAPGRHARTGWAGLAAAGLGVSVYLQPAAAIGVAAIGVWFAAIEILPAAWRSRYRWMLIGAGAAGLGAALAGMYATGLLEAALERYRWSPGWLRKHQDEATYYHKLLLDLYPTFWPLFPFAALIGFRRNPKLMGFCAIVFLVSFIGLSFAGMKTPRYLSFVMAFFFAVFALALAEILPRLSVFATREVAAVVPVALRWARGGVLGLGVLFVAFANPFFERSMQALSGGLSWPTADWSGLERLIGDWDAVSFRITVDELHTVVYGQDYDVLFNASRMTEMPVDREFVVDPRTGRPVIETAESVRLLAACHPEGLLIATRGWWQEWGARMTEVFHAVKRETAMRAGGPLVVIKWQGGAASREACRAVPG